MSALKTSGVEPCHGLNTNSSSGRSPAAGQRFGINHLWVKTPEKARGWQLRQPINLVM
ncbi:MAG: hypothetical protein ACRC8Y_15980 [Chroococcales cyanobacterium]